MMGSDRTTKRYELNELAQAADAIRAGAIIAFPTETVYGLGANAFDSEAIAGIFKAKGRPQDNPLIVHVSNATMLHQVASHVPDVAQSLIDRFWPGPLTLLLPKSERIPSSVTAGLPTVAVRMPSDPVAIEFIRLADVPLVAPSANLSGRPSGTTWQAVAEDLDGKIDGIVCGPATQIGLESTVLDVLHDPPRILRHGAIDIAMLRSALPGIIDASQTIATNQQHAPASPGMKHRHYQPKASVRICSMAEQGADSSAKSGNRGWIGIHPPERSSDYVMVVQCDNIEDYASRLFETFRMMDHRGIDIIDCEAVPLEGIGMAIMDRLKRASLKS